MAGKSKIPNVFEQSNNNNNDNKICLSLAAAKQPATTTHTQFGKLSLHLRI